MYETAEFGLLGIVLALSVGIRAVDLLPHCLHKPITDSNAKLQHALYFIVIWIFTVKACLPLLNSLRVLQIGLAAIVAYAVREHINDIVCSVRILLNLLTVSFVLENSRGETFNIVAIRFASVAITSIREAKTCILPSREIFNGSYTVVQAHNTARAETGA